MHVVINVAVAVIHYQDHYLLAYRNEHQHQGDRYEFVGGKIESGEATTTALIREVQEEVGLGLKVNQLVKLGRIRHDYGDKCVRLHIFKARLTQTQYQQFAHCNTGLEGQALRWVKKADLIAGSLPLPDANQPILSWLQLPESIVITYPLSHFSSHTDPLSAWIEYHQHHLPQCSSVYLRPKFEQLLNCDGTTSKSVDIRSIIKLIPQSGLIVTANNINNLDNHFAKSYQKDIHDAFDSHGLDCLSHANIAWLTTLAVTALMQVRPDLMVILPNSIYHGVTTTPSYLTKQANDFCATDNPQYFAESTAWTKAMLEPFYEKGQILAHHIPQSDLMQSLSGLNMVNHEANIDTDEQVKESLLSTRFSHIRSPLIVSSHDQESIEAANKLAKMRVKHHLGPVIGLFISPVQPTKTHPQMQNLGWCTFKELSDSADMPVIALGGLSLNDLAEANNYGGASVAGIRQFMVV